jgi:hypothetical protein
LKILVFPHRPNFSAGLTGKFRQDLATLTGSQNWGLFLEAGISKNFYATNSGSPEVDLRFSSLLILFRY